MIKKLKLAFHEARSKLTTYVALGIAAVAQLAEHAEDLVTSWPQLKGYLPAGPALDRFSHYTLTALGFLVIWTRIRRTLGIKPTLPAPAPDAVR